jgi:large subunit ribosomal protein L35
VNAKGYASALTENFEPASACSHGEDSKAMPRNSTKPKKKLKTHRGARKRFKITANGKILRMHSGKRHLLGTKPARRMRKLKKLTKVSPQDVAAVKQMLPYGC